MVRSAAILVLMLLVACGEVSRLLPLAPDAVILAFGDSLTYGTGAADGEDYPAVLAGLTGRVVVNAGVPGEESAAGLARLPAVLDDVRPSLVILAHGGNDLIRQRDPEAIASNLRGMAEAARARGAAVVLLGVPRPAIFLHAHALYADLAAELGVPLEADVLADTLAVPELKSDPIHPNAAGYRGIAEAIDRLLRNAGAL
jgi:lysophospholipase L1-like esterase